MSLAIYFKLFEVYFLSFLLLELAIGLEKNPKFNNDIITTFG